MPFKPQFYGPFCAEDSLRFNWDSQWAPYLPVLTLNRLAPLATRIPCSGSTLNPSHLGSPYMRSIQLGPRSVGKSLFWRTHVTCDSLTCLKFRFVSSPLQPTLRTRFHIGNQQPAICRMDRSAGIRTADGGVAGSVDPPRAHPGDEWRQLPAKKQSKEEGSRRRVGRFRSADDMGDLPKIRKRNACVALTSRNTHPVDPRAFRNRKPPAHRSRCDCC